MHLNLFFIFSNDGDWWDLCNLICISHIWLVQWSSMYLGRQSSSSFLHDWKTSPDSKLGKNRRGIGWKTQVCDQLPDWPIVYRIFYVFVCVFVIVFVFVSVFVAVFLLLQVKKQEFATSFRDWPHLPTPLNISCLIKNLRRLTQNQSLAREQGSGFQFSVYWEADWKTCSDEVELIFRYM